jgi:hypothetical protein
MGLRGTMTGQCAICEAALPDGAQHCPACGFPVALADLAARLMIELPEPESSFAPLREPVETASRVRATATPAGSVARDPQVEVVNRIARDVSHAVSLLQDLGGDGTDIANELAQAAFTEAEGRVGEVLVLLRDAQGRVSLRLKDQFDSRLKQLEERQTAMIGSGVSVNLGTELDRIRIDVRAGRRESALQRIEVVDRNLSKMESDWRGLQGLLRQIEALRESARQLLLDVADPDDSLRQVRTILAQPSVDVGGLDHAAELAAEALMKLHDAVPLAVEEALDRHGQQTAKWPLGHEARRHAVELDREARKLLKANRLVEATQRVLELGELVAATGVPALPRAIEEPSLAPDPAPASSPEPAPSPTSFARLPSFSPHPAERVERPAVFPPRRLVSSGPAPSLPSHSAVPPTPPEPAPPAGRAPAETVRALVGQARELAARIQRLPAGSELARAAAAEIRMATDLLRERKMDAAERTLSDLKARLDRELQGNTE